MQTDAKEQLRKLRIAIAVACAEQQIRQRHVAERIGVPATTLSNWLLGVHPAPEDLVARLELALGFKAGSLAALTSTPRGDERR